MEKLIEYLNKYGFYFACSDEQLNIAQQACVRGILQPIETLCPEQKDTNFFVRAQLKTRRELPNVMYIKFPPPELKVCQIKKGGIYQFEIDKYSIGIYVRVLRQAETGKFEVTPVSGNGCFYVEERQLIVLGE